jgi:hypothetical protein
MTDEELVKQMVAVRDSGQDWRRMLMLALYLDCPVCHQRCECIANAVEAVPCPEMTEAELAEFLNRGFKWGCKAAIEQGLDGMWATVTSPEGTRRVKVVERHGDSPGVRGALEELKRLKKP